MKFYKWYFLLFVLLFIVECLIALYVNDAIIRPYGGDYLVVMLVYCFVMAFINKPPVMVALASLMFAYLVELSQYLNLAVRLGLGQSKFAMTVMGSSFNWIDMLAYTLGAITITLIEQQRSKNKPVLHA
ncbi:DUF2809 domain-containing protein [Mucilaginibacter sp. UR6-1]|uniref:ribosomal maturation YjgA family protein n=1 Tax=Mucilaginibacter sp. UR6-1 TaxID=1435643 RepID=UPI001E6332AD|nr:DUF2809 domain-containing protein [Mucilaginibacter sp. UR6-1]MCC8408004.1 DUF2809 domain-containing protein [Mucilaginibacter sp. UR6-1]